MPKNDKIIQPALTRIHVGKVLHTTRRGTKYKFIKLTNQFDVCYSINTSKKTLPYSTIHRAFSDSSHRTVINANWYSSNFEHEYKTRPCNNPVLQKILEIIQNRPNHLD